MATAQELNSLVPLAFADPSTLARHKASTPAIARIIAEGPRPWLLAVFPKSGSTFTVRVLARLFGLRQARLSYYFGDSEQDLYFPYCLMNFAQPVIAQKHVRASDANLMLIDFFELRPVILVRDIFDVMVSMRDHLCNNYRDLAAGKPDRDLSFRLPTGHDLFVDEPFFVLDAGRQLDLIIDNMLPWYLNFYLSWRRAIDTGRVRALWTNYRELVEDDVAFIRRIISFNGMEIDDARIQDAIREVSGDRQGARINAAVEGRGREQLSQAQIDRITQRARSYDRGDFHDIGIG